MILYAIAVNNLIAAHGNGCLHIYHLKRQAEAAIEAVKSQFPEAEVVGVKVGLE